MLGGERPLRASTARNAQVVVAVILVGAALGWGAGILTPLALAMFLAVMIDSFARRLAQRAPFVSARAALPAAIALSALILVIVVLVMAANAGRFAGQLTVFGDKLDAAIAKLAAVLHLQVPPKLSELIARLNPAAYLGVVAQGVEGFSSKAVLVIIYLGFILASRQGFSNKAASLFRNEQDRDRAGQLFLRIRDSIERYLWVQTLACAIVALASWAVMEALGLNDAAFWAFVIFIVGYIPIIGGAIGTLAPPLFALIQFDGWWQAAVMLAALAMIGGFVGNVIYPRMQGRSLNIDPVVILLSLAFWGTIWGLSGMLLSTPLTVAAMVILAQFNGTRWIAVLLSSDGDPIGEPDAEQSRVEPGAAPAPVTKA
jgi:predicted PurR-regulated permease PerM